jgi:hypothetical protein
MTNELVEQWLVALGDQVAGPADDWHTARAHMRIRRVEEQIRKTPATGLMIIAAKMAVARFIQEPDDCGMSDAAYRDLCGMAGRDIEAEARAAR